MHKTDPQSRRHKRSAFTAVFNELLLWVNLKMDKNYSYKPNAYHTEGFDWDWKHGYSEAGGMPNTAADLAPKHEPPIRL
jgi:hypothetical protein